MTTTTKTDLKISKKTEKKIIRKWTKKENNKWKLIKLKIMNEANKFDKIKKKSVNEHVNEKSYSMQNKQATFWIRWSK